MQPHNHHAIGLVIELTSGVFSIDLPLAVARNHHIQHIITLGDCDGLHLPNVTHIRAPFTQETAVRHCSNCDWVVLHQFQDAIALQDRISRARNHEEGPDVIRLTHPATDSPAPASVPAWLPGQEVTLLGVTIVTPGYEALGAEAVRRWQQFTGFPCLVLHAPSHRNAFRLKLQLPEFLPRMRVCYFDADLWLLRAPQFPTVKAGEVWAVPDAGIHDPAGFVAADCQNHRIEPDRYCNSGLWLADFRYQGSRQAWSNALNALGCMEWADYGDQSAWNWALQHSHAELRFLTPAHNWFLHSVRHGYAKEIPGAIIGLHAAGVPLDKKFDHLTRYAEAFGYEVRDVTATAPTPETSLPELEPELAPEALSTAPSPPFVSRLFVPPPKDINETGHFRAIEEAFHTLADKTASFDQRASARCYLTYRTIDGLVPFEVWETEVKFAYLPAAPSGQLGLRWRMSQLMADFYLCIQTGLNHPYIDWNDDWLVAIPRDYPPQILNYLRLLILDAYRIWLSQKDTFKPLNWKKTFQRLPDAWVESWKHLDTNEHPYRFTEAHGDLQALQTLMFIARAAGAMSFEDQDWCKVESCARDDYFGRALRKLGEINPERALWK